LLVIEIRGIKGAKRPTGAHLRMAGPAVASVYLE